MIGLGMVDMLATVRLTRLVARDTIFDWVRDPVLEALYADRAEIGAVRLHVGPARGAWRRYVANDETPPWLAELITCPWCISFWIGLCVVVLRGCVPRLWHPLACALAASEAAGIMAVFEDRR